MQNNNYIPEDFIIRNNFINQLLGEILKSKYAPKLIFKGGTMMTMFLDSHRFSEDLDFNVFNVSEGLEISKGIYSYLQGKGYELGELFTDWTNVYNIEVFYYVNNTKYTCQVEIFKEDFGLPTLSYQESFLGNPINIMNLEQSFAHKCCAYIERGDRTIPRSGRPKGRDLFDILHYINLGITPDMNVINSRLQLNNIYDLFIYIYKRIIVKHYKNLESFSYEIENFSYDNINGYDILEDLLNKINKVFLDNKMNIDIYYLSKIEQLHKENGKFNITEDLRCRFKDNYYEVIDLDEGTIIYKTKDVLKLKKYLNDILWV